MTVVHVNVWLPESVRISPWSLFPSVPDLKEYSVQVGLRHLNESSRHKRLHISRLICGPEGSNLVMLKLREYVPKQPERFQEEE